MQLRPHQKIPFDKIFAAFDRGINRQLIVMPTGSGKTVVFSLVFKERGGRSLVLVPRIELLEQARETILRVMPGASVGIVGAGQDDDQKQIVIATVQSLSRQKRLRQMPRTFRTVVYDEAHHAQSPTSRRILNHFASPDVLILGVTATPVYKTHKHESNVFEETVYEVGIAEGIREKWLCDIEGKQFYLVGADFNKAKVRQGDLYLPEVEAMMEAANWHEFVAKAYFEHAENRRTIIFTTSVAKAHQLAEYINGLGGKVLAIDGKMIGCKRREILDRLNAGTINAVINCAVLTEGFDDPSISCVLMARPTRSELLYRQCIGRGLRYQEGKTCLVLDMVGASERYDLDALAEKQFTLAKLAGVRMLRTEETLSAALDRGKQEADEAERLTAEMQARKVELYKKRESYPPCIYCQSPTGSNGKIPNGKQRFQCKNLACKRKFVEGTIPKKKTECPSCIYCQSPTSSHGKSESGKQQFICKNPACKRVFVEGAIPKLAEKLECPPCIYCQLPTKSAGKKRNGKRQFMCKSSACKRSFVEGAIPKLAEKLKCPPCIYCQSPTVGSGIQSGKQRFICKNSACKRQFIEGAIPKLKRTNSAQLEF